MDTNGSLLILCTDTVGKNTTTGRILQVIKGKDYGMSVRSGWFLKHDGLLYKQNGFSTSQIVPTRQPLKKFLYCISQNIKFSLHVLVIKNNVKLLC